ncbi:MAG: lipoate--protein ligase [Clostridia bacterium]|nr:lipoate--protein ligase [Clostridia bacterium]
MISTIRWIETPCGAPYGNLATEKVLMDRICPGECVLFLWQNRHTVVIGRNQDARTECRVDLLREEGGFLARRLSGGGAVYHDEGNLNFSFLMRREDEDPARQSEVILRAVRSLGIPAERTGRNDLESAGRKFSGHAWYRAADRCCHHGTLMMDVDLERMGRYLTAAPAKLRSRSVASVRSRVMNLKEQYPALDRGIMTERLIRAFEDVYALPAERGAVPEGAEADIFRETEKMASEAWLFPPRIPSSLRMESRFPWGGICLELEVERGRVKAADCRSDAMEEALIRDISKALEGCVYKSQAVTDRLTGLLLPEKAAAGKTERETRQRMLADITALIREQAEKPDSSDRM